MGSASYPMRLFLAISVLEYYNKDSERTLLYNDPDLHIDWKVEQPIVSKKDQQGTLLKNLGGDFTYT